MKKTLFLFLYLIAFAVPVLAETAPVSVRLPQEKAWVGQRLPFFIELRAPGTFQGAASFDLPHLPGTTIIKIGPPIVSSEEVDGQSWFIQSHEFALFSQRAGLLEIPPFSVRFANRTGFTGLASDVLANSPGMKVEIMQPPGSEKVGFLVTTDSLEISERWTPEPGPVQAGAIFKRTIVQRADQLSGMVLAPLPAATPDSIRVYSEDAIIQDKTERGEFLGERSDTITYQLTHAGSFTLPELTYVWWNPKSEKLATKTLPAVSFEVALAPSSSSVGNKSGVIWPWLLLPLLILALAIWQKKIIIRWLGKRWKELHPIDRVQARKLRRACRRNDAAAAGKAWASWRNTQAATFQPDPELQRSVLALHSHIFGSGHGGPWQGDELARAFAKQIKSDKQNSSREKVSILPELNG
jgi:hypothetical protein